MYVIRAACSAAAVIFVFSLGVLQPFNLYGETPTVYGLSIRVADSVPLYKTVEGDDVPVIVRMAKNVLNITLSANVASMAVTLHAGEAAPTVKNETNYYKWEFENGSWSDTVYGYYLLPSLCRLYTNGHTFSYVLGFSLAPNATVSVPWTIHITASGSEIYSRSVAVERFVRTLAASGDVMLRGEPYREGEVLNSSDTGTRLKLYNRGNVPGMVRIRTTALEDKISFINVPDILLPGDYAEVYVSMVAGNWSPRIMELKIIVTLNASFCAYHPVGFSFDPMVSAALSMTVYIGHGGYLIVQTGDYVFQYLRMIKMHGNETINVTAYITGDTTVNFSAHCANLKVVGVSLDGETTTLPLSLALNRSHEHKIVLTIKATKGNTVGYIYYEVSSPNYKKTYNTEVRIIGPVPKEPAAPEGQQSKTLSLIFITASLAAFIGVLVYYTIKNKELVRKRAGKK